MAKLVTDTRKWVQHCIVAIEDVKGFRGGAGYCHFGDEDIQFTSLKNT